MALSHLLQPNSTLRACTLGRIQGFAASRGRFNSSPSSHGDGDSPSPLKEEAAAVDTKIALPEKTESDRSLETPTSLGERLINEIRARMENRGFHKAVSLGNVADVKAKYGGLSNILSGIFTMKKDGPTETMVRRDGGEDLADYYRKKLKEDGTRSLSTGCQNGLTFEHSAPQSAEDQATLNTGRLGNLASVFHSNEPSNEPCEEYAEKIVVDNVFQSITTKLQNQLAIPSKPFSSKGLNKDNSSNDNVQRSDKNFVEETSKSGLDSSGLKDQKQHLKISLPMSNMQKSDKQVEGKERSKSCFHSGSVKEKKQHPKVSLPMSNMQRSNKQVEGNEARKPGFWSGELKELMQRPKVSLPKSDVQGSDNGIEDTETSKPGFDSSGLKDLKQRPKVSLPKSDVQGSDNGIEDTETSKPGFDSSGLKELKQCPNVSLPTSNRDQRQSRIQNSDFTESEENKVLVRFLSRSTSTNAISGFFNNCGRILKIECPDVQRPMLKTACVHFATRDGVEKAIGKSGLHIGGASIIVEPATSENTSTTIHVPSLLRDPDVPAALVKNPTRTIKMEQLTQEISSHHIIEALAFCNSNVSGYFLGSSNSVAYVELETEVGKERALAKQSINVLGKHLVMSRIDCPRTTVARITSRELLEPDEVLRICKSLGDFASSSVKSRHMIDVHYKAAEWPNMWKILNRLNGCIVNGRRLQAEAAPVFPPYVLLALWRRPEERRRLEATAKSLLLRLESPLDTSGLAFAQNDVFSS